MNYESLPDLPDSIGVAGPIVGLHNDVLIVAGGANFADSDSPDLWDVEKRYLDRAWVLTRKKESGQVSYEWNRDLSDFRMEVSIGYSAVVSTKFGVVAMGGENRDGLSNRAFLLRWQPPTQESQARLIESDWAVPDLPVKCTGAGAAIVDGYIYLVAAQVLDSRGNRVASRLVYRLGLDILKEEASRQKNANTDLWEPVKSWPDSSPGRMFPLITVQHDGFCNRLYVFGGRHYLPGKEKTDENLEFLRDGWSLAPGDLSKKTQPWRPIAESPVPLAAGSASPVGPAHIIFPGYATGEVLKQAMDSGQEMRDFDHPGFPKKAWAYHTITDRWTDFGVTPVNMVTTPTVVWDDQIMMISGESRPRVRSNKAWSISVRPQSRDFGRLNMMVVIIYLIGMVGIGVFFTFRNKTTDDFFRGGKQIPWWAAGCSIFATMLSSITYMAVPAKSFAQNWVYGLGSFMILAIAPVAVYIALPFFRAIDATSAYEYLEKRFNRTIRRIGSASFSIFHIFRMGVVLALAALALASVTPLTPAQCVLVMGALSIVYCTLGGIEAVIWTDTIQTIILLGGALLCVGFALHGSATGSFSEAVENGKTHFVNVDFGSDSFLIMSIWVVILGGFGQNLASYTADQAVVQRYMTTPDVRMASRSIWLNAIISIPASALFFFMGTTFWMFYRSHPEKLDPTIASDRIMPLFISQELPVGLAGLVVAGIFAAAQSTVSTSMNSSATTIVTDFLRPSHWCQSETGYLWSARLVTLAMGILGTAAGLLFVDPQIKSLFDQFIGILGLFMGVLAGLFALGATTKRANGPGSLCGAVFAIVVMMSIVLAANNKTVLGIDFRSIYEAAGSRIYLVNGYLYAFVGISICYIVGYLASLLFPAKSNSLDGLTLFTLSKSNHD